MCHLLICGEINQKLAMQHSNQPGLSVTSGQATRKAERADYNVYDESVWGGGTWQGA